MEKKIFISTDLVRNNALKLAHKLYMDGYRPDIMYICLRGGAYLGNVINEYYKIKQNGHPSILYAAVVARSYIQVGQSAKVRLDGWTYDPKRLNKDDNVLLVDDIFDSGVTLNFLVKELINSGIHRENVKIAVHDYKVRTFLKEQLPIQPDYFCQKHIINSPEEDVWFHYLSHELQGLTKSEVDMHYSRVQPDLAVIWESLLNGA